ncbi:hypothetical protein DERP_015265 [Dermatophagoides pteronyssinus]|uniref:Uncharacterized protein n=1 Tax=Dermatophagoides pteronyssinus TaxID=6956 RepID=A0ABQ8JKN4_DERPT|nr:hypothetical protein DERP_015265 [Dermatophagoides pteronyssinus]
MKHIRSLLLIFLVIFLIQKNISFIQSFKILLKLKKKTKQRSSKFANNNNNRFKKVRIVLKV